MTLFRSNTQRDIWHERWCETCYYGKQKDMCPIWAKAMRTGRKPSEWDRNTRTDEIWRSIKCNSYIKKPPVNRRAEKQFEDVPLFEVTPYAIDVGFVPVEGWPDRPPKDGVDHQ